MVEWIGIVVAVVAVGLAWRANGIARRALSITEQEHTQRLRDRAARARLEIATRVETYDPDDEGVIRLGGSGGSLRVAITVTNTGDRDAGSGSVEVMVPLTMSDRSVHWSDPGGGPLQDLTQHAARVGERNVITRPLAAVARDVPQRMWLTVPAGDAVQEYAIVIRVEAEGADSAEHEFPLRIGRSPGL